MNFNSQLQQHLTTDLHNVLEISGYSLNTQSESATSYFSGAQELIFSYGNITHIDTGRMRFNVIPPNDADFSDITDVLVTFKAIPLKALIQHLKSNQA